MGMSFQAWELMDKGEREAILIRAGIEADAAKELAAAGSNNSRAARAKITKALNTLDSKPGGDTGGSGGLGKGGGAAQGYAWPPNLATFAPKDMEVYGNIKQSTEMMIAIAETGKGTTTAGLQAAINVIFKMGDAPLMVWLLLTCAVTNKTFVANKAQGIIAGMSDVPGLFTMSNGSSSGEAGNFTAMAMCGHALMSVMFHDTSGRAKPDLAGGFLEAYMSKTSRTGLMGVASATNLKETRKNLLMEQAGVLGSWVPDGAWELLDIASRYEVGIDSGQGERIKLVLRSTEKDQSP